jgi:hypothetical protein
MHVHIRSAVHICAHTQENAYAYRIVGMCVCVGMYGASLKDTEAPML